MGPAPKNVLMVNHYAAFPGESATGSRHFSLARALNGIGWQATVICASSEHGHRGQRTTMHRRYKDETQDGVTLRRIRARSYAGNGIRRILNMFDFTHGLLRRDALADLPRPDIVIGSTVHPFAALAASVWARRLSVPFVFEIRDLWPESLIDLGRIRRGSLAARFLGAVERLLCNRAALIVTLMPEAHKYLHDAHKVERSKVIWVSNGVDSDTFAESNMSESAHSPFTFMYLGSLGQANGVDTIVKGFSKFMSSPARGVPARLIIVGTGTQKRALMKLASELHLSHCVEFQDAVPKAAVPRKIQDADALVVNVLDLPLYKYGISLNKLFDYLAASKPVLIASNASNNIVRDAEAGLQTPANAVAELAEGMLRMVGASDAERSRWGKNGRRLVETDYDYVVLAGRLAVELDQVLDNARIESE